MFTVADRVQETTNSPGTGTATLLGAVSGYQSFSTGIGANNTTFYVIADQLGTNWEVGLGALNATGTVLTRTTVYSSSNGGSTVNFATGTQYVWCDFPSSKSVIQGTAVNFSSIGATTAGTGAFTTLSATSTVSGAGFSNYFAAPPTIGNTTPNTGAFTTLSASSTVSGTGFSNYLASPPAIGNTTPNAGTFIAVTTNQLTIGTTQLGAGNASIMKNRIINGAMVIDQRNAGASVTPTNNQYSLDRWQFQGSQSSKLTMQQNAGSVTPPVGFVNYLGVTSSSAYSVGSTDYFLVRQAIEGYNMADLGWGTANAKTVTLSFQVYSSLTGTFGGSLSNNGDSRCYPFSYTVSSANTWTSISVTIAGDTTGTWQKTTSTGINIYFSMGTGSTYLGSAGTWAGTAYYGATGQTNLVGTNGATFYITGVQLEVGSSATGFEYRQYQQELALCQRYYMRWSNAIASNIGLATGVATGGNTPAVRRLTWSAPVPFRTQPTLSYAGSANLYTVGLTNLGVTAISFNSSGYNQISIDVNTTSSGTIGQGLMFILDGNNASTYFDASAEL